MAKKVVGQVKLQIAAGAANPSPPVGPALGQRGVNIMEFCKAFNAQTQNMQGLIIPVIVTVFADRSFTFITKSPPASVLLIKASGVAKGSPTPNKNKVGKVTRAQVEEIAKTKVKDLNAKDLARRDPHDRRHRPLDGHRSDRLSRAAGHARCPYRAVHVQAGPNDRLRNRVMAGKKYQEAAGKIDPNRKYPLERSAQDRG